MNNKEIKIKNEYTYDELFNALNIVTEAIEDEVYTYNSMGEILKYKIDSADGDSIIVSGEIPSIKARFYFRNHNKTWWTSKEEAIKESTQYLNEIAKYIDLNTFKKIIELKEKDRFFTKESLNGKPTFFQVDVKRSMFFDTDKKSLVSGFEFYNGERFEYKEIEYKISDYGVGWVLTIGELKNEN